MGSPNLPKGMLLNSSFIAFSGTCLPIGVAIGLIKKIPRSHGIDTHLEPSQIAGHWQRHSNYSPFAASIQHLTLLAFHASQTGHVNNTAPVTFYDFLFSHLFSHVLGNAKSAEHINLEYFLIIFGGNYTVSYLKSTWTPKFRRG